MKWELLRGVSWFRHPKDPSLLWEQKVWAFPGVSLCFQVNTVRSRGTAGHTRSPWSSWHILFVVDRGFICLKQGKARVWKGAKPALLPEQWRARGQFGLVHKATGSWELGPWRKGKEVKSMSASNSSHNIITLQLQVQISATEKRRGGYLLQLGNCWCLEQEYWA